MKTKALTVQDVKDFGAAQAKRPTEQAVRDAGFKVIRRDALGRFTDGGRYTWSAPFKTCDDRGKLTPEAHKYLELTKPGREAHEARMAKINAKKQADRAVLRAKDGSVHYIEPERADEVAKRNGWGHRVRVKGRCVMRTIGGKLYRRDKHGEWRAA